jgi:hypothetical protein
MVDWCDDASERKSEHYKRQMVDWCDDASERKSEHFTCVSEYIAHISMLIWFY